MRSAARPPAIVRAPRSLPRIIRLPPRVAGASTISCSCPRILHAFVDELFSGHAVKGCYQFRVTRNSELFVDEEESRTSHTALQRELLARGTSATRCGWRSPTTVRSPSWQFLLQHFELPRQRPSTASTARSTSVASREVHDQVRAAGAEIPAVPARPAAALDAPIFER